MNVQEDCPTCGSPVKVAGDGLTHWYVPLGPQQIVAANVAARGYRDGWTQEQFVARQLAKLQEEVSEAAISICTINSPKKLRRWIMESVRAGIRARYAFDTPELWRNTSVVDPDALRSELADMQVVILAAAQALDFDVVQAAIDKSSADVARGVR